MSGETSSSQEGLPSEQPSGGVTEHPILNGQTGKEVGRTIIPPGQTGGVEVTKDPKETEEEYQRTLAAARRVAGGGLPAPGLVIEHRPQPTEKSLGQRFWGWLTRRKK